MKQNIISTWSSTDRISRNKSKLRTWFWHTNLFSSFIDLLIKAGGLRSLNKGFFKTTSTAKNYFYFHCKKSPFVYSPLTSRNRVCECSSDINLRFRPSVACDLSEGALWAVAPEALASCSSPTAGRRPARFRPTSLSLHNIIDTK